MSQTPPPPGPPNPEEGPNPYASPASLPNQGHPNQGQADGASALDGIIPTNPLAAISCYSGIIGLIVCPCGVFLGPLAIVLGILGLKNWKAQESQYGKTMSSVRAYIGIVTGFLAVIASALVLFAMAFG